MSLSQWTASGKLWIFGFPQLAVNSVELQDTGKVNLDELSKGAGVLVQWWWK